MTQAAGSCWIVGVEMEGTLDSQIEEAALYSPKSWGFYMEDVEDGSLGAARAVRVLRFVSPERSRHASLIVECPDLTNLTHFTAVLLW